METHIKIEEAQHDNFTALVEAEMARLTDDPNPMNDVAYLRGSASYFYEQMPWAEAIDALEDPIGFFNFATQHLPTSFTEPKIREFIDAANRRVSDVGMHLMVIDPADKGGPEHVTIALPENEVFTTNPVKGAYRGAYLSSGDINIIFTGPFEKPTGAIKFLTKRPSHTTLLFVSSEAVRQEPMYSLITAAHEIGHGVEERFAKPRSTKFEHEEIVDVIPLTEREPCVWGMKMGLPSRLNDTILS